MRGLRTITSVVRTPCVSCSSLATALCLLRLSYVSQKTQTNCKENEHVKNLLRQPCNLVFRTAVLRCCSNYHQISTLSLLLPPCIRKSLVSKRNCSSAPVISNHAHLMAGDSGGIAGLNYSVLTSALSLQGF